MSVVTIEYRAVGASGMVACNYEIILIPSNTRMWIGPVDIASALADKMFFHLVVFPLLGGLLLILKRKQGGGYVHICDAALI